MPLRQAETGIARQMAPEVVLHHALAQHAGVAFAAHMVGQHAGPGQRLAGGVGVMAQAVGHSPERIRHRRCAQDAQHRNAQQPRNISRTGLAIMQPHHAFDQDQVRLLRSAMQAFADILLPVDPQIELVHRPPAGQLVPVRIQKIRPALEHLHTASGARMQARQPGGERGLALARGGRGDQQGDAGCHGASSSQMPSGPWWNTSSCTTRPCTRCSSMMRSILAEVTL